jgi:alkylhydroperoxidase family enzyme
MLNVMGASKQAIESILDYDNVDEFDAKDRLVIEYARQMTMDPNRVRDGIFDRLRDYFSEPEIVELTWRIAMCGAFNRFNDVLQLDIEDDAAAAFDDVA